MREAACGDGKGHTFSWALWYGGGRAAKYAPVEEAKVKRKMPHPGLCPGRNAAPLSFRAGAGPKPGKCRGRKFLKGCGYIWQEKSYTGSLC